MTPDQWFDKYGESHRHPINKAIHWFAVPSIFISIIGLLWAIPFPSFFPHFAPLNWATLTLLGVLIFYFRLSLSLGFGMLIFSTLSITLVSYYDSLRTPPTWLASLMLFITMWGFQFIGHALEGKKPAFIDDLKFLLIGPLWLMGFIFRALKIKY